MQLDFSDAPDQSEERKYGPVPAGSIVLVKLEVLKPNYPAPRDPNLSRTQRGLYQLFCRFTVLEGQYKDVYFSQGITLPAKYQEVQLDEKQKIACNIGAAQFKAICQSAFRGKLGVNSWLDFNGARFPVKVKIRNMPREYDGREYWNNEISRIVTPDWPEYAEIQKMPKGQREIINAGGAVTGNGAAAKTSQADNGQGVWDSGPEQSQAYEYDDMPF